MKAQKALITIIISLLLTTLMQEVNAQQSSLTFTLALGPYSVGFKSVNQYDYSRSFAKYDAEGKIVNEGGFRPIQTSIWYPASNESKSPSMLFEEYVYLMAYEEGFTEMTEETKANAKNKLMGRLSSPEERFKNELSVKTNAIKDAKPASGSFPVIVYAPGFSGQSFGNSVLCEYIASHGYIVVASPSMGMRSRPMTSDIVGVETQALDIGFLISFMHNYPNADDTRLAVMGLSWGGLSNVYAKMRNDNVKALICLDGSIRYYPERIKDSPFADISKIDVPFLYLAKVNESLEYFNSYNIDGSVITDNFYNSLKYSDAYLITFSQLVHLNFESYAIKLMERDSNDIYVRSREEVNQGYELVCQYVLNFLNAYFKNDKQGLAFLQNQPEQNGIPPYLVTKISKAAQNAPPSLREFAHLLHEKGFDKVSQTYADIKKSVPDFVLEENEVRRWGNELRTRGKIQEAIEIFKLNVKLYPESFKTYNSLGLAYMKNGEKELAIKYYEKSIELNPRNTRGILMLKTLKEQE